MRIETKKIKNNNIYILIEKVYNYDNLENTDSYIIGAFNTEEKAKKEMQKEIENNLQDFSFVENNDNALYKNKKIIFYNYIENWQNYIEFEIIEKNIQ